MLARVLRTLLGRAGGNARLRERAAEMFARRDYAGAAKAYASLSARGPEPAILVNLGYSRLFLDEPNQARRDFARALELRPGFAPAFTGLGDVLARQGRHEAAIHWYDRAIRADPALAVARNNRAQSLLVFGCLEESWRDAEARLDLAESTALYPHRFGLPRWGGEALAGRRLLVHWEQGLGDIIQHLRFLPRLHEKVGDFDFECPPPLLRLAQGMQGAGRVIEARNEAQPEANYDCVASLLSLPHLLGVKTDALPPAPYLRVSPDEAVSALSREWRLDPCKLVGIVWRGSDFDPSRNADLQAMLGLAAPGLRLVSLQYQPDAEEETLMRLHGIINAAAAFRDFHDAALVIAALDAVVAVDTAVAHLAGALARPVLLLLNEPAAPRWMLQRADSPWYASMRLLRKESKQPWSDCVSQAARELTGFGGQRAG